MSSIYLRRNSCHPIGTSYHQSSNGHVYGKSPKEKIAPQHYTFRDPSVCGPAFSQTGSPRSYAEHYIEDAPKYRQLPCRTFISVGTCPYRERCVYLHDPRLMSRDARTKTRKKNKEDIVQDSLFWPVLSYHEISQHLDVFRLPHVVQRYGVPAPHEDQYRRHDQAVYSIWMNFVTFCSLETIANPYENAAEMSAYFHPEFETAHRHSLRDCNTHHHEGIFLDETLTVNPFINRRRLAVFMRMGFGLSLSAECVDSDKAEKFSVKFPSGKSTSSPIARSAPGQMYSRWSSEFASRSNEHERDQILNELEREKERERERQRVQQFGNVTQLKDHYLEHVTFGRSVHPSFNECSSMDDIPVPSVHTTSYGSGDGYRPDEEGEEAHRLKDFYLGSYSCASTDSAATYNSCATPERQVVFHQSQSHLSNSDLVSTPTKLHCAESGGVSPTSVSNCVSPGNARDSITNWQMRLESERNRENEKHQMLRNSGMKRMQLISPVHYTKSLNLAATSEEEALNDSHSLTWREQKEQRFDSLLAPVPDTFPYLKCREEDCGSLPSYLFRTISSL